MSLEIKSRAKLLSNVTLSNFKRLEKPYKLTFALTYQCNFKCKMCKIWSSPVKKEISAEDVEKFFYKNSFFNWIDFTGGEIFLRSDLQEIFDIVVSRCKNLAYLHFPTNGYFNDQVLTVVEHLLRRFKGKLVVTVSLNGPPPLHNEICGVPDSWSKGLETFITLRKKFPEVGSYIGYTLMRGNENSLQDFVNQVKIIYPLFRFDDIHINIFQTSSHYYQNNNVMKPDFQKVLREVDTVRNKLTFRFSSHGWIEKKFMNGIPDYYFKKQLPVNCSALSASCFIDPYGNIFPCICYNKKIGNIYEIDFDLSSIWKTSDISALQKDIFYGSCPVCWTACEAFPSILGSLFNKRKTGGIN